MTIRVAVAEDSFILREGLGQLLAASPGLEMVASCADLPSLVDAVTNDAPEVVLTDIRMPPSHSDEGIRFAAGLRQTHPSVGVVVLSQYSEPNYVLGLLESGSDRRGYLLKDSVHNRGELVSAIDAVARGGSYIDPKIVEVLVASRARASHSALSELTPREREVLAQLATGKGNTAIAESLVLTKRAIEKHINSIFMKLGFGASDDVSKRVTATLMFLAEVDSTHLTGSPAAGKPGP